MLFGPAKAKIKIIKDDELKTGAKISMDSSDVISVQFNPNKLNFKEAVVYNEKTKIASKKARNTPTGVFAIQKPRELSLELLFDTYTSIRPDKLKNDVKDEVDKFTNLVNSVDGRPPKIFFSWGSIQFKGVITNLSYTYTLFTSSGKPARATMNLTLKEYKLE
jgi:hypothetical protein